MFLAEEKKELLKHLAVNDIIQDYDNGHESSRSL